MDPRDDTGGQERQAPAAGGSSDVPEGGRPADFQRRPREAATDATRAVGRGIGRAATGAVHVTARTGRYAARRVHAYTHAGGAGESGLARMTELHASHTAGDTVMMLALAGILYLNPQTAQARSQVAAFLLMTMVPFVLLAPFIGPLLDRFSHGRRWAIGTTTAVRAFLCWVLAEAIGGNSGWLFPAALACLVASKAYNVTRAAAVPRLLPAGTTLVAANSRVSMAGVVGAVIGAAVGGLALLAGPAWALRAAFVIFVFGTVQAIRLPEQVDSSEGELDLQDTVPIRTRPPAAGASGAGPATRHTPAVERVADEALTVDSLGPIGRFRRRKAAIPWPVMHSMWSTGGTRVLTGFLILYLAFLTKEQPIDGLSGPLVIGLVAVAIGIGNALGSVLGGVVQASHPERTAMLSVMGAMVVCVATGIWYGIWTLVLLGFAQGLSAQLAKLCFDALVQRDVPERVRTSVFGWSETMLQMLWV
ncbi:MAG TPA: MFS transporter, partial [Humibacillus xanthopallidus]|nr:MFS transporter [Humibacillus xanthopallidus]